MYSPSTLEQILKYQKATKQREQEQILYQIAVNFKLFTVRELEQITQRGKQLSETQQQLVLGFIESYFNLDLGQI